MSKIRKAVIVNPSILSEKLLLNKKFKIDYKSICLNLNAITENEQVLRNCNLIILDDLESAIINDTDILLLNQYRVFESKTSSISEIFEKYFNRTPVVRFSKGWAASKSLLNIKISRHIELSKRVFDTLSILFFLPLILFFLLIGVILIFFTSKGPVFFRQERVGKNGKTFNLYKLRSMTYSKEGHVEHTKVNDIRVFPVGKFLRYTKIDELPQCLNVLKGDMSIIGPRPEKTEIVKKLDIENPYYELRHLVRPGITGWAQVNNPIATPNQNFEKLEYDLFYIKNANLFLEIKIIFKTIIIILKRNSL